MKQVIDGAVYDTERAQRICEWPDNDVEEYGGLFRTKSGKFFAHDFDTQAEKEVIRPLDRLDVAIALYDLIGDVDIVKQIIGVKPSDESDKQLAVKLDNATYSLMRETAADKGVSMASLVEDMVHNYCVPAFNDIPDDDFIEFLVKGNTTYEEELRQNQWFDISSAKYLMLDEDERQLVANGITQEIWNEIEGYDKDVDYEHWQGELMDLKQIGLVFMLNTLEKVWPGWIEDYDESCYEEEIDEDEYDLVLRKTLRDDFDIYQKPDKVWSKGYFESVHGKIAYVNAAPNKPAGSSE